MKPLNVWYKSDVMLPKHNLFLNAIAAPRLVMLQAFCDVTCQLWHHWDEMLRRLELPPHWSEPLWVLHGIANFHLMRYLWPEKKIQRCGGQIYSDD